jgi:CheY-like chemotaxis protein/HPt (histidine-containing phosphotransfer) domain-containing protein
VISAALPSLAPSQPALARAIGSPPATAASGLLARRGHTVVVTENGAEALARLEERTFDVVLMDLQMPVMDGIAATLAIRTRERESGGRVRIVAMTAHAMSSDRQRCLDAGMDGYISKPVNPQTLFAAVEGAAVAAVASTAAATGAGSPIGSAAGGPTFDEVGLLARASGSAELMTAVIGMFLEDCPGRLAAIEEAVTRKDAEALRKAAHAPKGAAGNLSAAATCEAADALERIGAESRLEAAPAAWQRLSEEAGRLVDQLRRRLDADAVASWPCAS